MIRARLSRRIAVAAVALGSLTLAAFVLTAVTFDPGRPARVLQAMVSSPAGRSVVAQAVRDAVERADAQVSPAQASALGSRVANDPELTGALAHAGESGPASVTSALLASVKRADPQIAGVLARNVPVRGSLIPTSVSSTAQSIHDAAQRVVRAGLWLTLLLAGLALLLGPGRDRIARRLGRACLVACAAQIAIWVALPALLDHMSGRGAAIAAAGLRAGGHGLLWVFVLVLGAGLMLLLGGLAGRLLGPISATRDAPAVRR